MTEKHESAVPESDWCGLCGSKKKGDGDEHGAGVCVRVCEVCKDPKTAPHGCLCDVYRETGGPK